MFNQGKSSNKWLSLGNKCTLTNYLISKHFDTCCVQTGTAGAFKLCLISSERRSGYLDSVSASAQCGVSGPLLSPLFSCHLPCLQCFEKCGDPSQSSTVWWLEWQAKKMFCCCCCFNTLRIGSASSHHYMSGRTKFFTKQFRFDFWIIIHPNYRRKCGPACYLCRTFVTDEEELCTNPALRLWASFEQTSLHPRICFCFSWAFVI